MRPKKTFSSQHFLIEAKLQTNLFGKIGRHPHRLVSGDVVAVLLQDTIIRRCLTARYYHTQITSGARDGFLIGPFARQPVTAGNVFYMRSN